MTLFLWLTCVCSYKIDTIVILKCFGIQNVKHEIYASSIGNKALCFTNICKPLIDSNVSSCYYILGAA